MSLYRKHGIIVGVLYIVATVAGSISVGVSAPIQKIPLDLVTIAGQGNQIFVAVLFMFVMAITVAGTAIWAYPVLINHDKALALAFVCGRTVEGALYIVSVVSLMILPTLGQAYIDAGKPDSVFFSAAATLLKTASDLGFIVGMTVFEVAALIFYWLLFRTRLVPRWLSVWGAIAIPLAAIATWLPVTGIAHTESSMLNLLNAPIAAQEMVMAVWLIVKGFREQSV